MKAGRHKKYQKELAKTRLLKLSNTTHIVTAFSRHNTKSQMVKIVTVTMLCLGNLTLSLQKFILQFFQQTEIVNCNAHVNPINLWNLVV
jgi:hypothetical protein